MQQPSWYTRVLAGVPRWSLDLHAVTTLLSLPGGPPVYMGDWSGTVELSPEELDLELRDLCAPDDTSHWPAIYDHCNEPENFGVWYFADHGALNFELRCTSQHGCLQIATTDLNVFRHARSWAWNRLSQDRPENSVYTIVAHNDRFKPTLLDLSGAPLVRANYTPTAVTRFDRAVSALNSGDPGGRVVLVSGAPGTGKTHMVRGLINAVENAVFVTLPPGMLESLASPSMVPMLLELHAESDGAQIIFLLEDADDALVPRDQGNMGLISTLLNFGDGLIGTALNVCVVATTNQAVRKIDPAVSRPGRLIEHIEVRPLKEAEALAVLAGLNPEATLPTGVTESIGFVREAQTTYTLAELYARARNAARS